VAGDYTLKITDGAADDEGTLVRWGIVAEVAPAE
jgi:subtilisin-like proprotein convertase family protein